MSPVRQKNAMLVRMHILALLWLACGISGCRSTAGLFLPVDNHPQLLNEARSAVLQQNPDALESILIDLERRTSTRSRMLYLLESGRLYELSGELEASMQKFSEASTLAENQDMEASFTATESLQQALAMVTNDRALPYKAKLFERLFLYYFQSLNYLQANQPQKARIELNKALRDMRWWKDNLPVLRNRADQMLDQKGIRANELPPGFDFNAGDESTSSSDNALVYYLSGLLHQASGDRDRAEIDYRNALAYIPDATPLLHALETLDEPRSGLSRLVIIHESDWVAAKVPYSISVYINRNLYSLSFPFYPESTKRWIIPDLPLRFDSSIPPQYPVLNLNTAAHRALQEEFPAILLRQALRMLAKHELQEEAREEDPWLGLAASIFSVLSDQPDLRSWLSLPASISLSDSTLPPGIYDVPNLGQVDLKPGQILLLRAISSQGAVIKVDSLAIPSYHSTQ
ncbi:hypothetical protein G0Q06_10925 [Puniceicoccales bacterium CK1056]|uniref:Tetratricopeptide repeat protein n=1 Tax=Oceanipulchritudo coccoides TaxID=2706888 RepID=A0A6B2M3H2_9BACT|nr:hypothetical protein [Oceanipulchritudo coccoides]NDV62966.1 hypothetical protein [Oceanipulchritudo coccoides]